MPEEKQSSSQPASRPIVQPMPLQRANYGAPPRPSAMAPAATQPTPPRMTDVISPVRPFQPPTAQAPAPPRPMQPATTALATPTTPASPVAATAAVQPLFSASPVAAKTLAKPKNSSKVLGKWRLTVLLIGALLALGGGARWATAGNTTGDTVAVAAVKANDGRTMTIQFTATDGQLHKFSEKSQTALIPGTAVEVAYRPGAPEATVKRVSVISDNRALGVRLFTVGAALLMVAAIASLIHKLRRAKLAAPLTTPVTI